MCSPFYIWYVDMPVDEIANLMHWEVREDMESENTLPYGVYIDTSEGKVDGVYVIDDKSEQK